MARIRPDACHSQPSTYLINNAITGWWKSASRYLNAATPAAMPSG